MTVVATLKQKKRNVQDSLTATHEAALRGEPAPVSVACQESEVANGGMIPVFTT